MTRKGVEYNLKVTPYISEVDGVTYCFSDVHHLEKFKTGYKENRSIFNDYLSYRVKADVIADILADISLYIRIETRGFLIKAGGVYICQPEILLNGTIRTKDA